MIVYKDRCYCNSTDCGVTTCTSRLTKEVKSLAARARLPIDMADLSKVCPCYVAKRKI